MSLSPNFWVAAATAGPVIALSNAVATGRMLQLASSARSNGDGLGGDVFRRAFLASLAALVSFAATAAVTVWALISLATGHAGGISAGTVVALLIVSFFLLLAQVVLEVQARDIVTDWRQEERGRREREKRERAKREQPPAADVHSEADGGPASSSVPDPAEP